jgi:peroxiredoxin
VDAIDGAEKMRAAYEVPFPLLSDSDLKAHEAYRVIHTLDAEGVAKLKHHGLDIERWSGRDHHKVAIAAMFLVGKDGKVRFAHASADYMTRPHVDQVLQRVTAR